MRHIRAIALAAALAALVGAQASAAAPRVFSVALDGYRASLPAIQFGISLVNRHGVVNATCPRRCAVSFAKLQGPVTYHVTEDVPPSAEAYTTALGPVYAVASYGACKHPRLNPEVSSCTGKVSRSTTVRVHLTYRPLVTALVTGSIHDPRPTTFYSGVGIDVQNKVPDSDDASVDCTFKIESVSGERCRYRLDPGTTEVRVTDGNGAYLFDGFTGACAGHEILVTPAADCEFTLGESDVMVGARVKPPPDDTMTAPLDSNLPGRPRLKGSTSSPSLADFQGNPGKALDALLDALFDTYYGHGQLTFLFEVAAFRATGVTIKGYAGGAVGSRASAAAARPLIFSASLKADDDELTPLTVRLTAAGRRLFARPGRHAIKITGSYDPPSGATVRRSRSGRVRG